MSSKARSIMEGVAAMLEKNGRKRELKSSTQHEGDDTGAPQGASSPTKDGNDIGASLEKSNNPKAPANAKNVAGKRTTVISPDEVEDGIKPALDNNTAKVGKEPPRRKPQLSIKG